MKIESLSRFSLAHLPTPLERMDNLSRALKGPSLLIKRDDQTGLALGGNKTRKLEFLIADALDQGADVVITAGGAQSNHCRQTAAAAARAGLRCDLVLGGEKPGCPTGNLLLNQLLGARIHWTVPERREDAMLALANTLQAEGRNPYIIPIGGSNAVGATGYALAMMEAAEQLDAKGWTADHIVFASSSGGTQAGLVAGARAAGFTGRMVGISIDKGRGGEVPYEEELAKLSTEIADRIGLKARFSVEDFIVNYDYMGGGYGVMGDLEREAIRLMAKHEAILLDPVYTARAMGALIVMILRNIFPRHETVLFWHTGGAPALFAYTEELGN